MTRFSKIFVLVFLCLIWGVNWVAIKISLEGLPPFYSAGLRFLLGTVTLYAYVKWKKISLKVERKDVGYLVLSAFLMYIVDYGLIFWGEQYISAGVTSIFFSTFALLTAFFSNFVFKSESVSWNKYAGLLIGFGGILIVFYDQLVLTKFDFLVTMASLAILGAATGAALATVIIKKFLTKMNSVVLSYHQTWMGTVFLLVLAFIVEDYTAIQLTARIVWVMIYMGVIASSLAFVLYYNLLKEMSAVSLSFIIYVIPLVALGADYIIYGEVLSLRSIIGMFIVFSGIWLDRLNVKPKH